MSVWTPHTKIIKDRSRGVTYNLSRKLGTGSYGNVWAANLEGAPLEQEPQFAIKEFFWRPRQMTWDQYEENVQREFYIGRLLSSVNNGAFCESFGVCSSKIFRVGPGSRPIMFIVFPFVKGISFEQLLSEFYPTYNVEDPSEYYDKGLMMAEKLMTTLGAMHALGIYHMDIKPENVLVSFDEQGQVDTVRFIDYGLSCATFGDGTVLNAIGASPKSEKYTLCYDRDGDVGAVYNTTSWYRDPRTGGAPDGFKDWYVEDGVTYRPKRSNERSVVFSKNQVRHLWPKFDLFSAAVIVHLIFDPNQRKLRQGMYKAGRKDESRHHLGVYGTIYMPKGLLFITQSMVGDLKDRRSASEYAIQLSALRTMIRTRKRVMSTDEATLSDTST